ncbi:MAG: hypothetical protein ABW167_07710 [Baekduia sp.]
METAKVAEDGRDAECVVRVRSVARIAKLRPPRCPSCGWLLVPAKPLLMTGNPLGLWQVVCPNPNKPDQHFPRCALPVSSNGFRIVRPKEAAYR